MSASLGYGYIARKVNRKAALRAFLRTALPWVGSVGVVFVYALVSTFGGCA
jgi:hypothetical protein